MKMTTNLAPNISGSDYLWCNTKVLRIVGFPERGDTETSGTASLATDEAEAEIAISRGAAPAVE